MANEQDTRGRILETAWALVADRGVTGLTMEEIARAAGLSRQAVYLHFGTRAGLLVAMTNHHDARSDIRNRMVVARTAPGPAQAALTAYLRLWCAYLVDILPVARALEMAAVTDPAARTAWEERMAGLRSGLGQLVRRLVAEGRLVERWDAEEATEWLWSQVHPDNWHHLVVDRGWSRRRYTERLIQTVLRVMVREVGARRGRLR